MTLILSGNKANTSGLQGLLLASVVVDSNFCIEPSSELVGGAVFSDSEGNTPLSN